LSESNDGVLMSRFASGRQATKGTYCAGTAAALPGVCVS